VKAESARIYRHLVAFSRTHLHPHFISSASVSLPYISTANTPLYLITSFCIIQTFSNPTCSAFHHTALPTTATMSDTIKSPSHNAEAAPKFTERELQILGWAMQSLKSGPPEVSYNLPTYSCAPLTSSDRLRQARQLCRHDEPPFSQQRLGRPQEETHDPN
jgi:hypothetical protein